MNLSVEQILEQHTDDNHELTIQRLRDYVNRPKITSLDIFKGLILVLMVLVGIIFTFSLFGHLLFDKNVRNLLGYTISFVFFFNHLNIFEKYNPLFGLLVFSITLNDTFNFDINSMYLLNIIWIIASLYTQISFMGTLTVVLTFTNAGFVVGCFGGLSYYSGYNTLNSIDTCFVLSLILNFCLYFDHNKKINVFKSGIQFWGTFCGMVSLLIYTGTYFRELHNINFWVAKVLFSVICIGLMYFGLMLNVNSYTNLGGMFLFLCLLEMEYYICKDLDSLTFASFVILVNLYLLKELITRYPKYFTF